MGRGYHRWKKGNGQSKKTEISPCYPKLQVMAGRSLPADGRKAHRLSLPGEAQQAAVPSLITHPKTLSAPQFHSDRIQGQNSLSSFEILSQAVLQVSSLQAAKLSADIATVQFLQAQVQLPSQADHHPHQAHADEDFYQ
jgi:hypothetical protein